jgi:hypothetical protein
MTDEQEDIVISCKLDRGLASILKKLCQQKGTTPSAFIRELLTRILQDKKTDLSEEKKMLEALPKKTQGMIDRVIEIKGEIKRLEAVQEQRGFLSSLFDGPSEEALAIKRCRQELAKLRVELKKEVDEGEVQNKSGSFL